MRNNFQESFDQLKGMMRQNLDLLRKLVAQSESLAKIIESIPSSQSSMQGTREDLQKTKEEIERSIGGLLEQTEKLFDFYDQLMRNTFKS